MEKLIEQFSKSQTAASAEVLSGKNVLIHGVAGTGKTYLLNNLQNLTEKKVHLTSATGSASLQLEGGRTISSFLGLGLYDEDATFYCPFVLDNSILVIDEIFMIGKEQWPFIFKSIMRNSRDHRTVQIVIAGDPYQMPPMHWDVPLDFDVELKDFASVELKEIVRQEDTDFISRLMGIRFYGLSKEDLSWLYQNSGNPERRGTTIVATRTIMDQMNETIVKGEIKFSYDLREIEDKDKSYETLEIWEGMKVIITSNNFKAGYVNGDTGVVVGFSDNSEATIVKLDRNGNEVHVKEVTKIYTKEVSTIDEETKEVKITLVKDFYSYAPLLLAYYLSIRRVQGATLTYGCIHESILTSKSIPVQYSAFSRFKSIWNVYIEKVSSKKVRKKKQILT